ncbi:hypothetical protein [Methylopila sp. M107]|uniref:hypothetical protein n=1 Tax=Methylopila sp. M107 TaxID=1101190 RepID=UPI000382D54D|nr:hypothetical protein [Methylopila sp. M107]
MRPVVSVSQRYDFSDLLSAIPRSAFGFQSVLTEIAGSAIRMRTVVGGFAAIFALMLGVEYIRDAIAPDPDDQFRSGVGEIVYCGFMLAGFAIIYGALITLQWLSLRLVGVKASMRTVAVAILASELPQLFVGAACFVAFVVAHAFGANVRFGSTYTVIETAIMAVVSCFYLTWAISVVADTTTGKATLAVLLGPGLIFALLLWFAVSSV